MNHSTSPARHLGLVMATLMVAIASPSHANASSGAGLHTKVLSIRETRGPNGRCDVGFQFSGDLLRDYNSLLGIHLIRAIDDTGTDLCPTNSSQGAGWSSGGNIGFAPLRGSHWERPGSDRFDGVSLKTSSREAKSIKLIEGELGLFLPTFKNGGTVAIPDFRADPGADLQSPELKKLGVKVAFHTKESFEAARKQAERERPTGTISIVHSNQDEGSLFPGVLGDPENSPRNYIVLKVSDPEQKLVGFGFVNQDGRMLPVSNQRSANDLRAFTFNLPVLPDKITLYAYVATTNAVKRIPFKVENIPLP